MCQRFQSTGKLGSNEYMEIKILVVAGRKKEKEELNKGPIVEGWRRWTHLSHF